MMGSAEGITAPNNVVGGGVGMVADPGEHQEMPEEEEMPQGVRMAAPAPDDRQEQPEVEKPVPDDDMLLIDSSDSSIADQLRSNVSESGDLLDLDDDLDGLDDLDLD